MFKKEVRRFTMISRAFVSKILLALGLAALSLSASALVQKLDSVVAVVNKDVITRSELDDKVSLMVAQYADQIQVLPPRDVLRKQILDRMIIDLLQVQYAKSTGIEIDSVSVDQAIKQIANQQGLSQGELRKSIEEQGVSFATFVDQMKTELTISQLQQRDILQDVTVSKADIDSFLNSPVGQDQTGVEYHLGHILVMMPDRPTPAELDKTKEKAEGIVKSLKKGSNFQQMAMANSDGRNALKGGDLDWKKIGQLPTLFVKHVPSMNVGEVVGPIRSASGYHIIKLMNKRMGEEELHVETHVRQILIKPGKHTSDAEAKAALEKLRQQILDGGQFAKLAEQKSEELSTASKGGDLGWVTEDTVLPKFYRKINKLAVNDISRPFKTELGWHLVQVLDRRTQNTSMEAARNQAVQVLRERRFNEKLSAWLKRLRDESKVEVMMDA